MTKGRKQKSKIAEEKSGLTFVDAKERYLQHLKLKGYSPLTVQGAGSALRHVERFLVRVGKSGESLAGLGPGDMDELLQGLAEYRDLRTGRHLGARQVLSRLGSVRRFFRFLHEKELIPSNPAEAISVGPKIETAPRGVMTREEVQRILEAPDVTEPGGLRDRAVLEVLYGCGLRAAELLALDLGDVDLKKGFVVVRCGKGSRDRVVPVADTAEEWLERYLLFVRPELIGEGPAIGALWLNSKGRRLGKGFLTEMISRYKGQAGVDKPGSAHSFRHSIATHLLDAGMDLRYIQEFLGHRRISSTQIYTTVAMGSLRNKLEELHPRVRMEIRQGKEG